MAAPVATARTLNGVQDTPIDSDDAPYYRAKTGVVVPIGFVGNILAQISFVSRATRGDVSATGFAPQGVFVGAFVKQATRADIAITSFAPVLASISWTTIPALTVDRTAAFPQQFGPMRAYLNDPSALTTSVEMIDQSVAFVPMDCQASGSLTLTAQRAGTILSALGGLPFGQGWTTVGAPVPSNIGDLYEVKLTTISGTLNSGTLGSYLPLTADRAWTKTAIGTFSGTLAIRLVGAAVDSATAIMTLRVT